MLLIQRMLCNYDLYPFALMYGVNMKDISPLPVDLPTMQSYTEIPSIKERPFSLQSFEEVGHNFAKKREKRSSKPYHQRNLRVPNNPRYSKSSTLHHCPFEHCSEEYPGKYCYESMLVHFSTLHRKEIWPGKYYLTGPGKCPFNGCETTKTYRNFASHMDKHYPRKEELQFPCERCGKLFLRLPDKQKHYNRQICSIND